MNNDDTKVTEPLKLQQIMMLMTIERGAISARNLMSLANDIANTQYYQAIKEHELYRYQSEVPKTISTWEDYCHTVIKVPMASVDREIAELPDSIGVFEELKVLHNVPHLAPNLNKNVALLQELLK